MKFRKKILTEDRDYHSPDGVLSVTPEKKRHWSEKVAHFLGKGFDIPVFWDHQDDPAKSRPIQRKGEKRRRAKGQAGWLTGAEVSDDGALSIEVDVPKAEDAEQLQHNLSKVSPVLWDAITDGDGEKHEDVIGAVDLVIHPVDNTQSEFVACSITRLSLDHDPVIYRLASDEDMEEEDKTAAEQGARIKAVLEALEKLNIVLSSDTNAENLLEHLHQALLTAAAMEDDGMSEQLDESSPEFAQLSLERKNSERFRKHADKQHRDSIAKRLSLLLESGRCTPKEAEDRNEAVGAIRLSLDDEGNHTPTTVEAWIESREAVPAGTFFDGARKLAVEEVPAPRDESDELTDEEADKIADEILGRS